MKTIISIVISGDNIEGQPLAKVNAVSYGGKGKRPAQISYFGPVISHKVVTKAIADIFGVKVEK